MKFIYCMLLACTAAIVCAQSGYQFVYPIGNTNEHNAETVVIIRPGQSISENERLLIANTATVRSFQGGGSDVPFDAVLLDNNRVLVLRPVSSFNYSDTITVTLPSSILRDTNGNIIPEYQFKFVIRKDPYYYRTQDDEYTQYLYGGGGGIQYETLGETAPGDIFHTALSGFNGGGIVNNDGQLIHSFSGILWDLKTQLNNQVISRFSDIGGFQVLDTNYQPIKLYVTGLGTQTDFHDFVLLPNGNGLLFGRHQATYDMSALVAGGNPAAQIAGTIIQEVDSLTGLPIFAWRSIDYYLPTDVINDSGGDIDFTRANFEMTHTNAIDIAADGHILVSMRDMNEVTKINRLTGDIIWRLGGRHSSFTFVNDADNGFKMQHCVKWVPGTSNQISMLDNGVFRPAPSAAKIYELDETNMTATLVRSYYNPQNYVSAIMGSVQVLPEKHLLIGWGQNAGFYSPEPAIMAMEIDSTNQPVWQMRNVGSVFPAYRVFRHVWKEGLSVTQQLYTSGSLQVQVVENPTTDHIHLELSDATTIYNAQINVFATNGQLVYSTQVAPNTRNYRIDIPCNAWQSGSYFYTVRTSASLRSGIVQVLNNNRE